MPNICIQNLSLKFKNFELKNINLEIKKGEYFVILGETGAGKTLLIECVAGLRDYEGKIFINNIDIKNIPIEKRNIGFVYQDYALFPNLNVYNNIAFGLKVRNFKKNVIKEKVFEISKFLGIENLLDRKIENLSGGEKQRIALARALIIEPEILILDEPFSSLDPNTQNEIKNFLKKIHKEKNLTIIHITHNFEEAISLADRIAIIYKGEILQIGTAEEIFRKPKNEIVAKFIGTENLFKGISRIENGISIININGIEIFSTTLIEGNVYVIIHPENIIISKEKIPSSARNIFNGKILEISSKERIIRVLVDIKIPLIVYITKQSYDDLNLNINDEIFVYFKASSIYVF